MSSNIGCGCSATHSIVVIAGITGNGDHVAGARHGDAQRGLGIQLGITGALCKLAVLADAVNGDVADGRGNVSLLALDGEPRESGRVYVLEVPQGSNTQLPNEAIST